jgi:membrane associated rhomboid family serine protease
MAKCDACGKYENLPYQCRRCGRTFCAEHRLPENHDCPGLQEWNDPGGIFDSGFDDSVSNRGRTSGGFASRVTGTGGPLGYFRGNMTYVFLGLMWVTFAFQYFVFPLIGLVPGSQPWDSIFVLRSNHLAYVWTWITSIFAHGGFGHIAFNSIALYFFGPVVERRIGSNRYTALFLVGGVLAALGQVAVSFLLGEAAFGLVGASGAIMAIMGVLTVLNPHLRVYLYFFIPMPLWLLTFGYALISVFFGLNGGGGNVAHIAHLAGLVAGLAYGQHVKDEIRPVRSLRFGGGAGGPGRRGPF